MITPAILAMPKERIVSNAEAWRTCGFPQAVYTCVLACSKGVIDHPGVRDRTIEGSNYFEHTAYMHSGHASPSRVALLSHVTDIAQHDIPHQFAQITPPLIISASP